MKSFLKTRKGMICCIAAAVVLVAAVAIGSYALWLSGQNKFQDLTIELGTEAVSLKDFTTRYARTGKISFVSDPAVVDLNKTGQTELTLKHGNREETVTLTVQDTTAPTANILQRYCVSDYTIPEAGALVSDIQDEDTVSVYYELQPVIPLNYTDTTVRVVVEDASGNRVSQDCVLSFRWLREEYDLELGDTLTKDMLLFNPQRDEGFLGQDMLDYINETGVGTYVVTGQVNGIEQSCTVTVQDTQGPELVLENVQRYPGKEVELEDFVRSVSDATGVEAVRLVSEVSTETLGKFTVVVEAKDTCGNVSTGETTLWVTNDMTAPKLTGSLATLTVDKHAGIDLLEGFYAEDQVDGACEVVCDTGKLDLTKAGTYYVTYSATDTSGNVASAKRKVIVNHDEEDTKALVKEIAATLSDDVEEIRDYVRNTIAYSSSWGDEDPIWYGFTDKVGNCYVHALTLQALLEEKGYETQLIWVTSKTHYWLIVKLPEGWRHIDATPSPIHSRYSIMTDDLRYATLSGRNWDRSAWPACVEETEGE